MDRAQTRLLVVLSILVLAIAGVLFWQGEPTGEEADPESTLEVWSLDGEQVRSVRVERPEGALEIERQDGVWRVRAPYDARADDDQVRELVSMLAGIRRGIPVEAPSERASDFGLGEVPEASVVVTTDDGAQHRLLVGREAPVGYRTYVRAPEGPIAAVNGDANRLLRADPARYRDRRLVRFDPGEVRDVSVRSPGGLLHLSGEKLDWWLEGYTRADADRVDELVVGLLDLRFDTVDEQLQAIASPAYEVRLSLADGTTLGFDVGAAAEGAAGAAVATLDGRSGTVWAGALGQLDRGPSDVGWRTAFGIRPEVADRVEFSTPEWAVRAHRDGPAWKADSRDAGKVYDGVLALSRAGIDYRRQPPAPPGEVAYTVTVAEGEREWTVEVGPPDEDGTRPARATAGGSPYRIAADALDGAIDALSPR